MPALLALAAAPAPPAKRDATPTSMAGLPRAQVGNAGAAVSFVEYEAEQGVGEWRPIGPDRTAGTLASEASGRRAVRLAQPGHSVTITLAAPANALTVRYSIPDSANGTGLTAALSLRANGEPLATLPLTSRFSFSYGRYPFSNRPADGRAHHFWNEQRVLLPRLLSAGTRLTLSGNAALSSVRWVALDLIDAEVAPPPLAAPGNALSLTQFGADPTGRTSARASLVRAIGAARRQRRSLFIPPGRFRVDGHVELDQVGISGAGAWHSLVAGSGLGFYSRRKGSSNVSLRHLAVESDVAERVDRHPLAAIGGTFSHSTFSDMFLSHAKVGVWIDGPATGLTLRRLRITDHAADGINLRREVTDSLIEQNFIRNVGDDGIALWSHRKADRRIVIRRNTVVAPLLANGIALYGGSDIQVTDNLVADTVTQGGGIHLGTRFASTPFSGRIHLSGNMLVRSGSLDPNWHFGIGALWFYALEQSIAASILVMDTTALDSSCEVLQMVGPHEVSAIRVERLTALRSGGVLGAMQTKGSMTISNLRIVPGPGIVEVIPGFQLADGGGNQDLTARRSPAAMRPACASGIAEHPAKGAPL